MLISLSDTGKRFNRDWIFRHLSYTFQPGTAYAITGSNGSGKSTLLQAIAGALTLSEGTIEYTRDKIIDPGTVFRHLSLATPMQELVEEQTLLEFLQFHEIFKPFLADLSVTDIIGILGLEAASHKQLRYFSSGMKQRVKLAQAIFSDTPCILLDEPCSNLDETGIAQYHSMIARYATGKLIIVSSNDRQEYSFCQEIINIEHYKTSRATV